MKRYYYEEILDFQPGQRYCESCQYGNLWFVVKTIPVEVSIDMTGSSGSVSTAKQLKFIATTDDGREINYLITKGLEHYGPSIYDEPAYLSREDVTKIILETQSQAKEQYNNGN